jgi:hypothetical protein
MRIPVYQNAQKSFLIVLALFFISTIVFISPVCGQDEPVLILDIYVANNYENITTTLIEGEPYQIFVSTENETVVFGVNITLLDQTNITSIDSPFITIIAPSFEDHDSFIITATKEGYISAEQEVSVIKGELVVSADRAIIEEKKEFQITVKDQKNNPVDAASISLSADATPVLTDINGIAYVDAPEVEQSTNIHIRVTKAGYTTGSLTIRVENAEGLNINISTPKFLQILPVLLAVIVVIVAMIYVFLRQRKTSMAPQITQREKTDEDSPKLDNETQRHQQETEHASYSVHEKKNVSPSHPSSRVEEIRIPVQEKKKETTILSEEKKPEIPPENQKQEPNEYFKGHDYMRYRIDELTGKIDQNTDGKWFEGERDSKYKVNEALKKSFKKKKDDEEDDK